MRIKEMASTPAQIRASRKYNIEKTVQMNITLNKVNDADIIAKLETVESRPQYIRRLIREDIAKEAEQR